MLASARDFLEQMKVQGKVCSYRILRVTNPASFAALPRFQAIVDYASQQDLDNSFTFMGENGRIKGGAHGHLASLVTDFRVSFTVDA